MREHLYVVEQSYRQLTSEHLSADADDEAAPDTIRSENLPDGCCSLIDADRTGEFIEQSAAQSGERSAETNLEESNGYTVQ